MHISYFYEHLLMALQNNAAPYYLGYGDVDFSYDAKKLPGTNENLDVWPYRWGSQQMGITPGHVELQWLWVPV